MCQGHTCLNLDIPFSFKSLIVELIFNDEKHKQDNAINKKQIEKTIPKYLFVILVVAWFLLIYYWAQIS